MTERDMSIDLDLHTQCRQAVEQVISRYHWQLLEIEEFVQRVMACISAGDVSKPWPAAVHVYCERLYLACCGKEGHDRQEQAFVELQHYLYDISFREHGELAPDVRYEVVNEVLLRVWQKLPTYRKPGAFLAIAAWELRSVIRPWWSRSRCLLPLETNDSRHAAGESSDPEAQALDNELRQRVRECFEQALRRHPRAKQQLEAVWLKYVLGIEDSTIGKLFEKPTASVHVLRSRGLVHLRAEPCWQLMAEEFHL